MTALLAELDIFLTQAYLQALFMRVCPKRLVVFESSLLL